jgi:hypothetical protein
VSGTQLTYLGFLANCDSTILKVKLEHGLRIDSLSAEEGLNRIAKLEHINKFQVTVGILSDYPILNHNENKFFCITKSFEVDFDPMDRRVDEKTRLRKLFDAMAEGAGGAGYLWNFFRLLRLYKEGNICQPMSYLHSTENEKLTTPI